MKYTSRATNRTVLRIGIAIVALVAMVIGTATFARADNSKIENGVSLSIASDGQGVEPSSTAQAPAPGTVFGPKVHLIPNGLPATITDPYLDITLNSPYGITDDANISGGLTGYHAVTDNVAQISSVETLNEDTANHTWTVRVHFSKLDPADDITIPVLFQYMQNTYYKAVTTVSAALYSADGTLLNSLTDPIEYRVGYTAKNGIKICSGSQNCGVIVGEEDAAHPGYSAIK